MARCLECNKECRDLATLHRHLRAHKLSQGKYYVKHFPRYDKLDGTPIVFKNYDQYVHSDFNTRGNLRDWLDRCELSEAQRYVEDLLLKRKADKNLSLALCQVELRSLPMPGMHYMNRKFGSYFAMCERLGFVNRFSQVGFSGVWKPFNAGHFIIADTREQLPWVFDGIKTKHDALPFGDYKLNDDDFSHRLVIERKALGDLYSTLTGNYNRFCVELYKAKDAGAYMVVVVEGAFDDVYAFSQRLKRAEVHISPEYVFHNIRILLHKFNNLQFLFVDGRNEAEVIVPKLFQADGQCQKVDLQYAYDTGNLCGTNPQNT